MSKRVADIVRGDVLGAMPEIGFYFAPYQQFHMLRIQLRNRVSIIFHDLFEGMFR